MSNSPHPSAKWHMRPWQSMSDYDAMLTLRQLCASTDGIDRASTNEFLPTLTSLQNAFPPYANALNERLRLTAAEAQLVGYGTVNWWDHAGGVSYMLHGYVHPDWRNQGIGTALLDWGETTAVSIARRESHSGNLLLRGFLRDTETAPQALLQTHGYQGYHAMLELAYHPAQQPAHPLPQGVQERPVTPADYRAVWEANESVFAGEPQRPAPSDAEFQAFMGETNPEQWVVLWDGAQVAGVAFNELWPNGSGEIHQLTVLPDYRRRGLARYLIAASIRLLQTAGAQTIRVTADADNNPAIQLYQSTGFQPVNRFIHYRKPLIE